MLCRTLLCWAFCALVSHGYLILDLLTINYSQIFVFPPFNQLLYGLTLGTKEKLFSRFQQLTRTNRQIDDNVLKSMMSLLKMMGGMFEHERKTPEFFIPRLGPDSFENLKKAIKKKLETSNGSAKENYSLKMHFLMENPKFFNPDITANLHQLMGFEDGYQISGRKTVEVIHSYQRDNDKSAIFGHLNCWNENVSIKSLQTSQLNLMKISKALIWSEEQVKPFVEEWWKIENMQSRIKRHASREFFFKRNLIKSMGSINMPLGDVIQFDPEDRVRGLSRKYRPEFNLGSLYYILRSATRSIVVMTLGSQYTDLSSVDFYAFRKSLATIEGLQDRILFVVPLSLNGAHILKETNQPGSHPIRFRCISAPSANETIESSISFVTSAIVSMMQLFPTATHKEIVDAILEGATKYTIDKVSGEIIVSNARKEYFDLSFKYGAGRLNLKGAIQSLKAKQALSKNIRNSKMK